MFFMYCVCHAFASVHCCLVVTCWERADLLALVCYVYCDFITFPFGVLGQVWYLIVLIPDLCCLSYFLDIFSLYNFYMNDSFFIFSPFKANGIFNKV